MAKAPLSQSLVITTDGIYKVPSAPIDIPAGVYTPPALKTLTFSGPLKIGVAAAGSIIGATLGSKIASNIPGITVNSAQRTYYGTPTDIGDGVTETLRRAAGSPKTSPIEVESDAPPPTIANTLGSSDLLGSSVAGFATLANLLDARLTAAGV